MSRGRASASERRGEGAGVAVDAERGRLRPLAVGGEANSEPAFLSGSERDPGAGVAGEDELVEVGPDNDGDAEIERRASLVADREQASAALGAGCPGSEVETGGREGHRGSDALAGQRDLGTAVRVAEEGQLRGLGAGADRDEATWAVQLAAGSSAAAVQLSSSRRKLPASPPEMAPVK